MIKLKLILFFLFSYCLLQAQESRQNELATYLKNNWATPEDYVISKFKDHDYVLIGEYGRIKHDVELIANLIPLLYKNGIYCLATEYGVSLHQKLIDSLITAPEFNRKRADSIMFRYNSLWGYKEYIDLYEAAWKVNHSLKPGEKKFRIVNLACLYFPCEKLHYMKNNLDLFMLKVFYDEIKKKKVKALIYTSSNRALTRYHTPDYDFENKIVNGYISRFGNVLYDSLKGKIFNIYLHAGWPSAKGFDVPCVRPVNGTIDSVMKKFKDKRVGFDVANSPFRKLSSADSYYALGHPGFTLGDYCDGYIYQDAFKNYEPITMEKNFITDKLLDDLKLYLKCSWWSKAKLKKINVKNANKKLFIDIRKDFRHLK